MTRNGQNMAIFESQILGIALYVRFADWEPWLRFSDGLQSYFMQKTNTNKLFMLWWKECWLVARPKKGQEVQCARKAAKATNAGIT